MKYVKITIFMFINILVLTMMAIPFVIGYVLSPIYAGLVSGFSLATAHIELMQIKLQMLTKKESDNE